MHVAMTKYKDNPWNELNPYKEGQQIYGRNQMVTKLVDAIYTNLQTILYGKSGIGKTSLLQAGCFPELRKRHFFPIIIRPGIMEKSEDYAAAVIEIIQDSAKEEILGIKPSLQSINVGDGIFTENRLCQFLCSTKFVDNRGDIYIPILIFDQFEEFLNNKKKYSNAVNFVKELYVLLDNTISIPAGFLEYSNYRLVFAIREDYLYCLEDIVDHYNLDELRYNRHRITALTDKQAQSVIEKTFRSAIDEISSDVLKRTTSIIIPAAKGQNQDADIRTPVLSLLGSLIYRQMAKGHGIGTINTDHELYLYYDEIMSEPAIPLEVRWFLEQRLITIDGRRDSMDYQSALLTNQISEEQIEYLVKEKKIIRIVDAGSGERRIEFSHDTICKALKPIIEMRENYYNKGKDLYYSSFDNEEKQPETVRYLSYAADLGHLDAQQKLANLYEEKVKGVEEDKSFKSSNSKRDRIIILLNGGEWIARKTKQRNSSVKYDVFFGYSRRDSVIVERFYKELLNYGYKVWIDTVGLMSGDDFVNRTIHAIESSAVFVFFASAYSYESSYAMRELEYAIAMNKTIIPIMLDDEKMSSRISLYLSTINWIDARDRNYLNYQVQALVKRIGIIDNYNVNIGQSSKLATINDYEIEMIRVEGGLFTMGTTLQQGGTNEDERPVHNVRVDSYYIAPTPVTQELWQNVMGAKVNLWQKLVGNTTSNSKNKNYPVVNISWNDCSRFIEKLNALTGKEFRLPTEAEWEFAAKGGARGRMNGYKYSGGNNIHRVSWNFENSDGTIHEVAKLQPNELGIYDMSGNVWEWCEDWYAPYPIDLVENPKGPNVGDKKVCRGGSWKSIGRDCRISIRKSEYPSNRSFDIGFRLAL